MADILIYDAAGNRVATTSRAFAIMEKKELMREHTLDFAVVNTDNARQYITPTAIFQVEGQKFSLINFKGNSGSNNITSVAAEHVSFSLNDYALPIGYAFVGTVSAIIADMLTQSGASAKFTVGTCAAISGSFAPNNTQPLNLRAAMLQLVTLGIEIDYDNYIINAPVQVGANNGKIFKFGRDLVDLDRTYDKSTNTMTYDIQIATLMRLPGALSSDTFAVGDTVTIQDALIGDAIQQRICCYVKCLDNPTQDNVTIGQFINDSTSKTVAMQIGIANSVQQADQYSNVSIDHKNGFMAISADKKIKVIMNGTNCFSVYTGTGTGLDNSWTLASSLDANGLQAGKLTTQYSNVYAVIGQNPTNSTEYGISLFNATNGQVLGIYDISTPTNKFTAFDIYNGIILRNVSGSATDIFVQIADDGIVLFGPVSLTTNSLSINGYNGYTGVMTFGTPYTATVEKGVIVGYY